MEASAIFTTLEGQRICGQLTTEDSGDSLAFVANEGTIYGLPQLQEGEVTLLTDAGKEPSAEAQRLRQKAILLRIKVAVSGGFKWE